MLDLDLLAANGIPYGLDAIDRLTAEANLLGDEGGLGHHGFLGRLGHLDRAIGERRVAYGHVACHRTTVENDPLVMQCHLLLDRGLDHIAPDARAATVDEALADRQPLLGELQRLGVLRTHPRAAIAAGSRRRRYR